MENKEAEIAVSSVTVNGQVDGTHDEAKQQSEDTVLPSSTDASTKPTHGDSTKLIEPEAARPDGESAEGSAQQSREASAERKPASVSASTAAPSYVPPVKRFSAVNINKKFLEKNQSATGASGVHTSASSSSRQSGPVVRPAPQTALSHSRLVTAKLTVTPLSASPGPGWSRPASATPSVSTPGTAPTPAEGKLVSLAPGVGNGPSHNAPASKLIQPQARSSLRQKVDGQGIPGKPAWRSVNSGDVSSGLGAPSDFPTAAEAAQGLLVKHADMKAAAEVVEAQKQALLETADAFRGVHLDPNAHHWDDMEEDDNDFLDGVIEFGDGRQYTIQADEQTKSESMLKGQVEGSNAVPSVGPVSKAERFADDFDRSWPRARHEQGPPHALDVHTGHRYEGPRSRSSLSETSSNFSAHSPASTRDHNQSRVLFNERSNRMEPYSNTNRPGLVAPGQHGPPHPPFQRNGVHDTFGQSSNHKLERDAPPHTFGSHIQVLQKPSHDRPRGPPDNRRDTDTFESGSVASQSSDGFERLKVREADGVNGTTAHSAIGDERGSRHSWARRGPPDSSGSGLHPHHRDLDRQPPPHVIQTQLPAAPETHSLPEIDPKPKRSVESKDDVSKGRQPSAQPSLPQATESVSAEPPADLDALRKAFLAESAERAKQRKQQEEEERLKAQERARKKAAELEARIAASKADDEKKKTEESGKAAAVQDSNLQPSLNSSETHQPNYSKPSEADVLHVIEDAVRSAVPVDSSQKNKPASDVTSARPWGRAPSTRGTERASTIDNVRKPSATPIADKADSWRAKSKPPMLPVQNSNNDISEEHILAASVPIVHAFESLQNEESMEVVDFKDFGRFIGEENPSAIPSRESERSLRTSRSVASDFFDATPDKPEPQTWRRSGPMKPPTDGPSALSKVDTSDSARSAISQPRPFHAYEREADHSPLSSSQSPLKTPSSSIDASSTAPHHLSQNHHAQPPLSPGLPRPMRNQAAFREAPLSALDDTMSRIKGALDGMHTSKPTSSMAETTSEPPKQTQSQPSISSTTGQFQPLAPKREKWLPPALRPPGTQQSGSRHEPFELTRPEPPRSPAPPDGKVVVSLPKISRPRSPLSKRQAIFAKNLSAGPMRWDIISLVPPPDGMNKKNLSMLDVLFRKSPHRKPRVVLPKSRRMPRHLEAVNTQQPARVVIPSGSLPSTVASGAFGRPSKTDQDSWRPTSTRSEVTTSTQPIPSELNVTSRSPPPDLNFVQSGQPNATLADNSHSRSSSKTKIAQKLLDGSDVGFYRDVRTQSTAVKSTVSHVTFTVTSELEGESDQAQSSLPRGTESRRTSMSAEVPLATSTHSHEVVAATPATVNAASSQPSFTDSRLTEKETDPLLRSHPVTPPSQSSSAAWVRSPARVDPEHLKAVWSQTSDKEGLPIINSLKGIADDLTTVPFSIHEVKSEDGGTPPLPGPVAPPSRMSASEVTRAFQTVPSGPSNALRPNPFSPGMGSPLNGHKPLKPTPIGHPQAPMDPNVPRPHYMGYPSHMHGHSPSPPTLVYSHVMPSTIQSPVTTPYGQPVWMPLPPQQGPQMMRPQPSSPYSPQLMPYSMPGQNGMYPTPTAAQPQPSPYTRPMGSQLLVSPVMPQASPVPPHMMYTTSPMLMHPPPPGAAPQPQPYAGAIGMGRGTMPPQVRMDQRHPPNPMSQPPAAPTPRFAVHNPGYNPVPPQSFIRPSW